MKKFMISSMMCLITLTSNAQVMTSATVDKIFDAVSQANDTEFVFNVDRDADVCGSAARKGRKRIADKALKFLIS